MAWIGIKLVQGGQWMKSAVVTRHWGRNCGMMRSPASGCRQAADVKRRQKPQGLIIFILVLYFSLLLLVEKIYFSSIHLMPLSVPCVTSQRHYLESGICAKKKRKTFISFTFCVSHTTKWRPRGAAAFEALNSFLLLLRAAVEGPRRRPASVRQISNYRQQLGVFAPHEELKKWGTASRPQNISFGLAN